MGSKNWSSDHLHKVKAYCESKWLLTMGLLIAVQTAQLSGQATDIQDEASQKPHVPSWAAFRGSGSIGHTTHVDPPLEWDTASGKNILWKAPVPKPGMNSPVVWEDKVYLTGGDADLRQIYCFDASSGTLLWVHDVVNIPGSPKKSELPDLMETSGFAASSTTTDGNHIGAIFATGDLICVDLEGKRVWAKNLGLPKNHYGHSSSLITDSGLLYVQYDQKEDSRLYAFELASGKLAWHIERGPISWSSPILIANNDRQELILTNCKTIDSYDPKTGEQLWSVPGMDGEVASSAAYANGIVFVANEYAAAAGIDIRDQSKTPEILWAWNDILPDASSPVANEKYVLIPSAYGIVNCLDSKTGKVYWEHEFEEGFYSSPILVGDRIYAIDLKGAMQIFLLADEFHILGTGEIHESTNATPAFVGNRIFIRGSKHLFCIETNAQLKD